MKTRDENLKLYSKQKAERVFRSFFLLDVDLYIKGMVSP